MSDLLWWQTETWIYFNLEDIWKNLQTWGAADTKLENSMALKKKERNPKYFGFLLLPTTEQQSLVVTSCQLTHVNPESWNMSEQSHSDWTFHVDAAFPAECG